MSDQNILESEIKLLLNHYNANNFAFVIQKSLKLVKKFPNAIMLYNLLGSSLQNTGNLDGAVEVFQSGLNVNNQYVPIMNNLSSVYKKLGEFKKAENLYKKIIKIEPKHFQVYVNYANFKRDFNQTDDAIKLYEKALEINPNVIELHYNLSLTYQGAGNLEKSNEYAKRCLEIDPNFTHANTIIKNNMNYKSESISIKDIEKKLEDKKLKDTDKQNLHFTIGKAYEDKKNYKKASEHFNLGNQIKKKINKFDMEKQIELFEKIKNNFKEINYNKININKNDKGNMIFILGMPRSGSTLTEQIISSHSKVYGLGETGILQRIFQKELININNGELKKDIKSMLQYDFDQVTDKLNHYLEFFNTNKAIYTDKTLLNFAHLGFIKIIFPNAKIIHTTRNPKDNCLSIYKNSFNQLHWSNDENDINKFYNLYKDLMNFWKKNLGNFIYELNYESLIQNPEKKIRELLNHCNLDFEKDCLKFYKNKNQVKTASITQVRNDFYASSINLYKKYEKEFKNLFKGL